VEAPWKQQEVERSIKSTIAVDEINRELRRNLTDSERGPRSDGPLARARDQLEQWRKLEADTLAKVNALEKQFAEITQLRRRHREITDPAVLAQMTQELAGARSSLREAQAAALEIRSLEAERLAAQRSFEAAAQRLREAREVAQRIDRNRSREADLERSLPEFIAREEEARAGLARTDAQLAATGSEAKELAAKEQQLDRLATALVRSLGKDEAVQRLASLEQAASSLTEIDAQLSLVGIAPKIVDQLDELDRQIGPTIERAIAQTFVAAAGRVVASLQPEIYGFFAGSVVEPGAGSLGGLLVGAGGALVFDYAFNWQRERLGRAEFEQANREALKVTKAELSRALQRDLLGAVDAWFDDAQTVVAEQKLGKKDHVVDGPS
jgi:hypothetical protein